MSSSEQLQFIDYRKPKLEAGDYTFDVLHKYGKPGGSQQVTPSGGIKVRVSSERVSINPDLIFAQYPPPGQSGDYATTLPHISVKKGTLPWTRSAYKQVAGAQQSYEPWIYVLVLNEGDFKSGRAIKHTTRTLDNLTDGAFFPAEQAKSLLNDPSLNGASQSVTTVDVKKSLFDKLVSNNKAQIEKLAHVRRRWQPDNNLFTAKDSTTHDLFDNKDVDTLTKQNILPDTTHSITVLTQGQSWLIQDQHANDYLIELDPENDLTFCKFTLKRELSVLLANRFGHADMQQFPQGVRNTVYLVSLEQYLNKDSGLFEVKGDQYIRLISLHQWWFNCTSKAIAFEQRAQAIDADSFKLPKDRIATGQAFAARLNAGMTGVSHQFRLGDRSVSWYRGPFAPCTVGDVSQIQLSNKQMGKEGEEYVATDADKLLTYIPDDGMFDASYAAAYELGRFLSMNQSQYSKSLAVYKRGRARYVRLVEEDEVRQQQSADLGIAIKQLPYAKLNENSVSQERAIIKQWLIELASLADVPSWYLIPDNNLVKPRSIRTFKIDPKWVQSLWLGALSLSGRPQITYQLFGEMHQELHPVVPCYGLLLRSDILWAYPSLNTEVRKIDGDTVDLKAVQNEKGENYTDYIESFPVHSWTYEHPIAPDTRCYLCREPFNYASLSLPVESLHYGVNRQPDASKAALSPYVKPLKFWGKTVTATPLDIPMNDVEQGIINIIELAKNMRDELADNPEVNATYRAQLDAFNGARIGRYLLEGQPKAEFTLGAD